MTSRDWLMLFIGVPIDKERDRLLVQLDPIRIMKGMFLLQQKLPATGRPDYIFQPYLYGPCSFEIYRDLDALTSEGLIESDREQDRSWGRYLPSYKGMVAADKLAEQIPPTILDQVKEIKRKVALTSFRQLLREVYRDYPQYAVNSVLQS